MGGAGRAARRFRLANGLRALALVDRELPLVATVMAYDAGSRNDPEGRCGLAHLVEHLVFRGDRSRPVGYPVMVERRGGESNAATGHDATRYVHLLPRQQLSLALWIEAQRMAEPVGRGLSEGLELERQVLLQERRQRVEAHPHGRDLERLHALLFDADHPYHRPTLGRADELEAIDEDDVHQFLRRRHFPENAVLVLVGDLPDDLELQVERTLGQVPAGPPSASRPGDPGTPAAHDRWQHLLRDVPRPRSYVAYATGGFGRPMAVAARLAANALALGPASRLRRSLVGAEGLALGVEAMVSVLRQATLLIFAATAAPGVDPRQLEESLAAEVAHTLPRLSPDVLTEARRRALHDHFFRYQNLVARAEDAARWLLWRDLGVDPLQQAHRYEEMAHEPFLAWSEQLVAAGQRTVLSIVPREKVA